MAKPFNPLGKRIHDLTSSYSLIRSFLGQQSGFIIGAVVQRIASRYPKMQVLQKRKEKGGRNASPFPKIKAYLGADPQVNYNYLFPVTSPPLVR